MTASRPAAIDWRRVFVRTVIGCELLFGMWRAAVWVAHWPGVVALAKHADHAIYMVQAHRVLAGGPLYPAWELAGPFYPAQGPELYPPLTVYGLLVPMALLPDLLWWLVPLGVVAAVVFWQSPTETAWAVILGLFVVESDTWVVITAGNPSMYVTAAIALATIWRPIAVLAVLHPRWRRWRWWACDRAVVGWSGRRSGRLASVVARLDRLCTRAEQLPRAGAVAPQGMGPAWDTTRSVGGALPRRRGCWTG